MPPPEISKARPLAPGIPRCLQLGKTGHPQGMPFGMGVGYQELNSELSSCGLPVREGKAWWGASGHPQKAIRLPPGPGCREGRGLETAPGAGVGGG